MIGLRSKSPAVTNTPRTASRVARALGLWPTPIFLPAACSKVQQGAASLSRYELLGHLTRTARPLSGAPVLVLRP